MFEQRPQPEQQAGGSQPMHYGDIFEEFQRAGEVIERMEAARLALRAEGYVTIGEIMGPELSDKYAALGGDPLAPI